MSFVICVGSYSNRDFYSDDDDDDWDLTLSDDEEMFQLQPFSKLANGNRVCVCVCVCVVT